MKIFCECLKKHAKRIINFKKDLNEVINKGTTGIIWKAKSCCICGERFKDKYSHDKKFFVCFYTDEYRAATCRICNLKHRIPKSFPQ